MRKTKNEVVHGLNVSNKLKSNGVLLRGGEWGYICYFIGRQSHHASQPKPNSTTLLTQLSLLLIKTTLLNHYHLTNFFFLLLLDTNHYIFISFNFPPLFNSLEIIYISITNNYTKKEKRSIIK